MTLHSLLFCIYMILCPPEELHLITPEYNTAISFTPRLSIHLSRGWMTLILR